MTILECNYYTKAGEIDIIARDEKYIVFIEVKFRRSNAYGYAVEAVDRRKQTRIRRTAQMYLCLNGYPEQTPCRFDVIGFDRIGSKLEITHIKDAF